MRQIHLIAIGSLKASWARDACKDYGDRIQKAAKFTVTELPASKQKDAQKQQEEECERILQALEKVEGIIFVLDERGQAYSSEALSKELQGYADHGTPVTFVIGGAYGLNDQVRSRADRLLRLSDMVLPHELCRIFFLEQLYRSQQIEKGTGYHH